MNREGLSSKKMFSRSFPSIFTGLASLMLAATIAGVLSGCKSLPPSKPAAQFTAEEARGAEVFHTYCASCHYPTTTRGLRGPGLQALTKVKSMPSGTPPTDDRIAYTIRHGHGMMPPQPVEDADLQTLLAYLHTL